MKTVIVSGAVANKYRKGGSVWTRLNYILGLRQLGYDVHFIEQIDGAACVDASGRVVPFADSANATWFQNIMKDFDLTETATLLLDDGAETIGRSFADLQHVAASADVLLNISGNLTTQELVSRVATTVLVDQDPGFTQFWHVLPDGSGRLRPHDYYYTVGENIGTSNNPVPTGDIKWRPTRQPIVLEHWPVVPGKQMSGFTTIANWRGTFGPIVHNGRTLGLKVHEFRKFIEIPKHVDLPFEIALDIHPADGKDFSNLVANGWQIVDPDVVAADPYSYRKYIQRSGAEFSVAQGIYVDVDTGWFSDRTIRYLATGRPVLVQSTGFERTIRGENGVVSFRTVEEAISGANRIINNYQEQCSAARAMAEKFFNSDDVLGRLMEEIGCPP